MLVIAPPKIIITKLDVPIILKANFIEKNSARYPTRIAPIATEPQLS